VGVAGAKPTGSTQHQWDELTQPVTKLGMVPYHAPWTRMNEEETSCKFKNLTVRRILVDFDRQFSNSSTAATTITISYISFSIMIDFGGLFRRWTTPEPITAVKPLTSVVYEHQLQSRYIGVGGTREYLTTNHGDKDLRKGEMDVCHHPSVPPGKHTADRRLWRLQEIDSQYWIIWLPIELTEVLFVRYKAAQKLTGVRLFPARSQRYPEPERLPAPAEGGRGPAQHVAADSIDCVVDEQR